MTLNDIQGTNEEMILGLQQETFDFFMKEFDPHTGLISDCTRPNSPSSIAATGLGIAAYVVGVERRFISRAEALKRILRILRFLSRVSRGLNQMRPATKAFIITF